MNMAERKARVSEFNGLMEKAIVKYQDVLGPQECVVHGDDVTECDEDCQINPISAIIRTWVLVQGWEISEGEDAGFGVPDYFVPEGSMSWESIGILTHALDDIRGVA
jgi:hypothetical protein